MQISIFHWHQRKVISIVSLEPRTYKTSDHLHNLTGSKCFLHSVTSIVYLLPSTPSSGNKLYHAMGCGLDEIQRNIWS